MKLSELKEGTTYECTLSGVKMVVVKTNKPVINDAGEEKTEKVYAGKFCIMNGETPTFLYDELCDGQLKEIND